MIGMHSNEAASRSVAPQAPQQPPPQGGTGVSPAQETIDKVGNETQPADGDIVIKSTLLGEEWDDTGPAAPPVQTPQARA